MEVRLLIFENLGYCFYEKHSSLESIIFFLIKNKKELNGLLFVLPADSVSCQSTLFFKKKSTFCDIIVFPMTTLLMQKKMLHT